MSRTIRKKPHNFCYQHPGVSSTVRESELFTYKFGSLSVDPISDVTKLNTFDDVGKKPPKTYRAARRKDKKVIEIQLKEFEEQ